MSYPLKAQNKMVTPNQYDDHDHNKTPSKIETLGRPVSNKGCWYKPEPGKTIENNNKAIKMYKKESISTEIQLRHNNNIHISAGLGTEL